MGKKWKESMEEIDTIICLKKINKDLKNIPKIVIKHKNNLHFFVFFSLHGIKMEEKVLNFSEKGIIKNVFHKKEKPISIEKVEIENNSVIWKKFIC